MSQSILLFYSKRCSHSRQFLEELPSIAAASSVHRICIDTTPRERIPSTVKSVPTLILAGQMTPLVGDQAFGWLREQQQLQAQAQKRTPGGLDPSSGGGPSGANAPSDGPSGWQSTEMGASFSDTYSFLDNSYTEMGTGSSQPAPSGSGGGSTIPKSFAYISTPAVDVKNPSFGGSIGGSIGGGAQMTHQGGYTPQSQHPAQPAHRQSMPSGYGSYPPNATMAPLTQNSSQGRGVPDELTQRLEALQHSRDEDMPLQRPRV